MILQLSVSFDLLMLGSNSADILGKIEVTIHNIRFRVDSGKTALSPEYAGMVFKALLHTIA